jgi:hypothetical protein
MPTRKRPQLAASANRVLRHSSETVQHPPGKSALRRFMLTFGAILSITGCGVAPDVKNVQLQPGDSNYPQLTESPKQIVQFTAIVPDSLSSEIHLIYNVRWHQDDRDPNKFTSPEGCAWTQQSPFYVDMTLALKRKGNSYTGSFSPDIFQRGDCDWHLTEIDSPNVRTAIAFFIDTLHTSGHPFTGLDLTTYSSHIWCTRKGNHPPRKSTQLNELIDCTNFEMIGLFTSPPPGFEVSVPLEDRKWNNTITKYLTSLTVKFHDLDALIPAYVESHHAEASIVH